jgi:hypothetical protein
MAQTGDVDVVVMTVKALGVNRVRVVLAYNGGKTEAQTEKKLVTTDDAQDEAIGTFLLRKGRHELLVAQDLPPFLALQQDTSMRSAGPANR